MVSISSSASLSAVRVLQSVNAQLNVTQSRISTGLKVASAKDGAAAWSAASTIRSDISTNQALRNGIDVAKSAADVAAASADQIVSALTTMKTAVIAYGGTTNTTDQAVYLSQITAAQQTILTALASSKSGDLDWLNSATKITVNVGVKSDGSMLTQEYTPANLTTGLATVTTTLDLADAAKVTAAASAIDTAITAASTLSANLGALSDNLSSSKEFLGKLADIKSAALSSLVDADMEEESARLSALQIRQQLATQAISIANSSASNVLRLFQ